MQRMKVEDDSVLVPSKSYVDEAHHLRMREAEKHALCF